MLNEDALRVLNAARVSRRYESGDVIFKQGDACRGLFCVDSGEVALRKTDDQGHAAIVRLAHAGQTIGYRSFFAGSAYSASAEALTPADVCFIERGTVEKLLGLEPKLGHRFLERTANDLRASEEARLEATNLPLRARLAHLLVTMKDRRASVDDSGDIVMELPLSRQDMAELLGARRESVARAITAMEEAGIVKFEGRLVRIPDLDALLDELEGAGAD